MNSFNLIPSQGPHLQIPSYWGLELQRINFGGGGAQFTPSSHLRYIFISTEPLQSWLIDIYILSIEEEYRYF